MSFNWLNYLTLAEHLMDHVTSLPDEEACYRSIVSRAYYAVYCQIRNYVQDTDGTIFSHNPHSELQNYLQKHPHCLRKSIGNRLEMLRDHRNQADYDNQLQGSIRRKAGLALKLARKITQTLDELSA